ncbi:MAG: ABC transporter permease [Clostridiales bacterium]|nr:ABC transporter permease [Clostridiales bacterium]
MSQNVGAKVDLRKKLAQNKMFSIGLILFGMFLLATFTNPYFFTEYNLQSVVRDLAFIGIVAIGQSCLLLLGELDLSVGKIASLSGVLGGMMMVNYGLNPWFSFVTCILLGALFGAINGTIITKLKLNAMVVTIGMQGLYGGINLVLTKGKAITKVPESIYVLGTGTFMKVPVPFLFTLAVLIIVVFLIKKTKFGRYVYAIGNSREAATILGVKTDSVRVKVYTLMGALSALAGMLMMARLGASQPSIGDNWPMNSIAASVIGGLALTGGVGNPAGALIGAAIIMLIQNMIVLYGVNVYWQTAVSGIVVVLAISIDSITVILGERRLRKAHIAKRNAGLAAAHKE